MILSNAIRQRIINLTKENNIKLKELSRRADVSYSTLMRFMGNENTMITTNTLHKLCLGMKIELVDFFDDNMFIDVLDGKEEIYQNYWNRNKISIK